MGGGNDSEWEDCALLLACPIDLVVACPLWFLRVVLHVYAWQRGCA
jgi:hypothetical protein